MNSDSARQQFNDICPPISQIVLNNFYSEHRELYSSMGMQQTVGSA